MNSILDSIGATIFAGAILLIVLRVNTSMMEANYQNNLRAISNEQLAGIDTLAGAIRILEEDFAKIGANASSPFVIADSNRITFKGDLDNNGVVDSVKYSLTALSIPAGGNPNLRFRLVRRQNTESGINGGIGVSQFRFTYYDSLGRPLNAPVGGSNLNRIRSIKVQIQVQSNMRVKNDLDTAYASAYWEKVISPRNLRAVK